VRENVSVLGELGGDFFVIKIEKEFAPLVA
jgi:hypothetical protein